MYTENNKYEWGIVSEDSLNDDFLNKKYKLAYWPDYGENRPLTEYLKLSALISNNYLTFTELFEQSGFDKKIIRSFLNTLHEFHHLEFMTCHEVHYLGSSTPEFS